MGVDLHMTCHHLTGSQCQISHRFSSDICSLLCVQWGAAYLKNILCGMTVGHVIWCGWYNTDKTKIQLVIFFVNDSATQDVGAWPLIVIWFYVTASSNSHSCVIYLAKKPLLESGCGWYGLIARKTWWVSMATCEVFCCLLLWSCGMELQQKELHVQCLCVGWSLAKPYANGWLWLLCSFDNAM